MNIYEMGDQDETFGPATVSTPVIPVLDLHADSILSSDFNSAPVDSIVDISNDQVAVSAGASVLFELFASFVFDNIEGLFHEGSVAFFDFDSEYQISNPGMTITSTPVILFWALLRLPGGCVGFWGMGIGIVLVSRERDTPPFAAETCNANGWSRRALINEFNEKSDQLSEVVDDAEIELFSDSCIKTCSNLYRSSNPGWRRRSELVRI
jgi:hypothetical protein